MCGAHHGLQGRVRSGRSAACGPRDPPTYGQALQQVQAYARQNQDPAPQLQHQVQVHQPAPRYNAPTANRRASMIQQDDHYHNADANNQDRSAQQ